MTIGGNAWDHRLSRVGNLDPVLLRRLVDLTCGLFAIGLFLRLADAEILLQGLWLIVAIGAFLYGLIAALWRIAVAAGVMVVYIAVSDAFGVPATEEQVEFTEWPLMVAIAVIVAVLADRVSTSARHYAKLYRQASERLVTAHEEERARLARELHDGVGQTLTAVILTLDAADTELTATRNHDAERWSSGRAARTRTRVVGARRNAPGRREVASHPRARDGPRRRAGQPGADGRSAGRGALRSGLAATRACSNPSWRSTSTGSSRRRSATPPGTATLTRSGSRPT